MKGAVYILLLVTLAYLTESVRMPFYMVEQARVIVAADVCPMMKGQQCPYMHQGRSSSHDMKDMKDMKGCCNPANSCNSCPICYTAELASPYTPEGYSSLVYRGYPETPDQSLADYAASTWKPPNA